MQPTSGRWAAANKLVKFHCRRAPAHYLSSCAGAFVLLLLSGCERGPIIGEQKDRTLEIEGDTIDVPSGTDLHDIVVRTSQQSRDFEPSQIQARPGDYLRFTVDDSRTHAIVFEPSAAEARTFLETGGQLRSPPLVTKGTSWVIALKGAPPGQYPFRCVIHNDTGQLTIAASNR